MNKRVIAECVIRFRDYAKIICRIRKCDAEDDTTGFKADVRGVAISGNEFDVAHI